MTYPVPFDEPRRQRVLDETGMLDSGVHPELDALTTLASERFGVPCANVSLVDRERQWYPSVVGPAMTQNPRAVGFCAHTITQDRPLVVPDAAQDPRFADNAAVTQGGIRFYAGAQVMLDGAAVGTFCVMDTAPRARIDGDLEADLRAYAALVTRYVEAHALARTPDVSLAERLDRERERLDRAARERARFVSLISHELRTPLNAVIGFADVLEQVGGSLSAEERASYLREIKAGGERLNDLVEASLRFAAANTKDIALACRPGQLSDVLSEAAHAQAAAAAERGQTVRVEDDALPPLDCDPAHCREIFSQLIGNAIKFGAPGATIRVAASLSGERQRVTIHNPGPGFQTTDPHTLTTPFSNDQSVTTRQADGLGLGLPLAYRLARLHGAEMSFANTDGGAVVTVLFPAYRTVRGDERAAETVDAA